MKKILLFFITTLVFLSMMSNTQFQLNNVDNYVNNDSPSLVKIPNRIIQNAKIQANSVPNPPTGLPTHGKIVIDGDSQIAANVNSGTGTINDPYIISGWNITTVDIYTIGIMNVDKPIIVENCYLNTGMYHLGFNIYLLNDTNVKILNNYIENSYKGIFVSGVSTSLNKNFIISGNTILTQLYGIQSIILSNSQISNNIISGLKYGGNTGFNSGTTNNVTFSNNKIYDSSIGIYSSNDVQSYYQSNIFVNDATGMDLEASINCTYTNNSVTSGSTGIQLIQGQNDKVSDNKLNSPVIGIYISGLGQNVVDGNYINNTSDTGIVAINSQDGGTISNNMIVNPTNNGIKLESSFNYKVTGNSITGSVATTSADILLNSSNRNVVLDNVLKESPLLLELRYSNLNNISGNIFLDSYGNASLILESNFNVIAKSIFNGSAGFDLILMNGSNNKIIENTFKQALYYNLFLINDKEEAVEGNYFLTAPTFGFSQALDSGKNNVFLYNYWTG